MWAPLVPYILGKKDKMIEYDRLTYTYAVGIDEPMHPDSSVCSRMTEVALSKCEFGCKIYADPRSLVRVLAHNSSYGCTKTKSMLQLVPV